MARKRIIDPNIWESEDFALLSMLGKILFIGLFSIADDEGRGKADPVYIRSKIFPHIAEKVRMTDIENALSEIAHSMSITFYAVDGKRYYALTHWNEWQKVDRPTPSKCPGPEESDAFDGSSTDPRRVLDERSTSTRRALDESSTSPRASGKDGEKEEVEERERKEKNQKKRIEKEDQEEREHCACARGFAAFWEHYPRKEAKASAEKEWDRLDPDDDLAQKILDDIERKRGSPQWKEEGGRYIPQPRTYLHQRRWEDIWTQEPSHGYDEHKTDNLDHLLTSLD